MLKKIMLPVVLFFMLLSSVVVVKAADDITTEAFHLAVERLGYPTLRDLNFNEYNILYEYNGDVFFITSANGLYVNSTYNKLVTVSSSDNYYVVKMLVDGEWVTNSSKSNYDFSYSKDFTTILASTFDIYSGGEVFFQQTPLPLILGMKEQMIAEMIQPEAVLEEVIAVLPMILVFLGGYLALRKALEVLREILSRA